MDGMATSAPVAESALVESTDTTTVEDAPVASTEDDEDDDDW